MLPTEVKDVERGRRLQKCAGGNEQQLARGTTDSSNPGTGEESQQDRGE